MRFGNHNTTGTTDDPVDRTTDSLDISDRIYQTGTQTGPLLVNSHSAGGDHVEEDVLQISGVGHWFLDGWIGDHAVEFLVDSGSSVTAMSRSLYQSLVRAGAPVGTVRSTTQTLHGANGTSIVVAGCSHCAVSFMGLLAQFPILVCDLASGTDAIIGTDVLGSVLPHTLDMKNGLLFTEGGASLQLHSRNDALSCRMFTVGHCSVPPIRKLCYTVLYGLLGDV